MHLVHVVLVGVRDRWMVARINGERVEIAAEDLRTAMERPVDEETLKRWRTRLQRLDVEGDG
jgi:hypothetical protein